MSSESHKTIFDKTGFVKESIIKGSAESNFAIYVGKIKNRREILKIVRKDYGLRLSQFDKEFVVSDLIKKHNEVKANINAVEVLAKDENSTYKWIFREFVEGESLASYKSDLPLLGYDIISKKFLSKSSTMIAEIKELIKNIQEIEVPEQHSSLLISRYPWNFSEYNIVEIEKYLGISLRNQSNLFQENFDNYSKEKNNKLSIGDLTPANIIADKEMRAVLSDYELFSFENYLMDITYLWLFLWRYPVLQNLLLKNEIKTDEDKIFFRMNTIRVLLFLYRWPFDCASGYTAEEKIKQNKNHIWKRYLVAAGESFEAIMDVKLMEEDGKNR